MKWKEVYFHQRVSRGSPTLSSTILPSMTALRKMPIKRTTVCQRGLASRKNGAQLCYDYAKKGQCRRGDGCRFGHQGDQSLWMGKAERKPSATFRRQKSDDKPEKVRGKRKKMVMSQRWYPVYGNVAASLTKKIDSGLIWLMKFGPVKVG